MKILYDISILGLGHAIPSERTGIYRVVENMTPILASIPDCRLTFCAPTVSGMSARYLNTRPDLKPIECKTNFLRRTVSHNYYKSYEIVAKAPRGLTVPYRAVRKVLHSADRFTQKITPALNRHSLSQADIYHSPFHALPAQTRHKRHLQRFLMVHDLIPILYPHYVLPRFADSFRATLRSLHPDDWALANSQATKDDLCAHHPIAPERVFVTPLAADPALFYPAEVTEQQRVRCKYNLPPGPYLLSLNTLEPRKNLDRLIRCFARLVQQEHLSDLNLVLTGSKGFDVNAILSEATTQAVKDRIVLAGRVEDEDLAGLYSGATAFVYPSLYEGFGLPPLEAMQCGTPVITSNTSSLPEVVGEAGLMITPTDEDGLCQSMLHLLTDAALHAEKAQRALERARLFSWERCAQLTVEAYKTALQQAQ